MPARHMSLVLAGVVLSAAMSASAAPLTVSFPFDGEASLGESAGPDKWQAYAAQAFAGPGKLGGGLRLPGRGGNGLYLPNPVAFFGDTASAGTIAMWVRPGFEPQDGSQRVLIDFMRDTGNTLVDGYETVILVDGTGLKARPALPVTLEVAGALSRDRWTHVAMTWDCQTGAALYVDGEMRAEARRAFEPTALQVDWPGRVGCHTPGGGFPFAGDIDELLLSTRPLTGAEVAAVASADAVAARPRLEITGDWVQEVQVRNAGETMARLRPCVWEAAADVPEPRWGYLPLAFGVSSPLVEYWVGGAIPGQPAEEAVDLAPGQTATIGLGGPASLWWRRVGLLDDSSGVELAGHTFTGLRVELDRLSPHVYEAGAPTRLGATITNDTGRGFACVLEAALQSPEGEPEGECFVPLGLGATDAAQLALSFPALAAGAHVLDLALVADGQSTPLWRRPIYAVPPGGVGEICDVGAAYTRVAGLEECLRAMGEDGVAVLRMGGKGGEYASATHNIATVAAHGFRVWRTPAVSYRDVCAAPERRAELAQTAEHLGRYLRDNPAVVMQSIAGEGLSAPPCYCAACDAAFRGYLRERFGTLQALNEAWGAQYADWDEVQQLGSAADIDDAAEKLKMMRVALELPEANTARWKQLFELDRGRAIEWKRWHDGVLVDWYTDFCRAFHSTNGGQTPAGEQPCWANFKTHVLYALAQVSDVGGIDLYLPGEGPTTLGYAAELFLNFDMNVSAYHRQGKPVMVHELYVQDNSPALLPEAQGWWLLGRGYGLMTYFTYNYYYEGQRAGKPLVFGLFDDGDAPYPAYESFRRFSADIKRFDQRHDYGSLRREEPEVALFLGDDVSLANDLETGGATWEAAGVHGHNGAYWLTERNGYCVEFVNDGTLDTLDHETVLIVPWCHVVRETSLQRLGDFARAGGTLIVDGPLGLYDDAYRPYAAVPAGALGDELGLGFTAYHDEDNQIAAGGGTIASRGVAEGIVTGGAEVLHHDAAGRPAVVETALGRGRVIWLLSSLGRKNLGRHPDPAALDLWGDLLERAGLAPRWRLVETTEAQDEGLLDVSVRFKGEREAFVFVVSFFGPTAGTLELRLPPGEYEATDALTDEPVSRRNEGNTWRLPLALAAEGTRVIRLHAIDGEGFGR